MYCVVQVDFFDFCNGLPPLSISVLEQEYKRLYTHIYYVMSLKFRIFNFRDNVPNLFVFLVVDHSVAVEMAAATGWYRGRVKAVPSGDCVVIMAMASSKPGPLPEKTITLSSLIAPRLVSVSS